MTVTAGHTCVHIDAHHACMHETLTSAFMGALMFDELALSSHSEPFALGAL